MLKIGIIVAVYNLSDKLDDLLNSLEKQDLPESEFEVVFVDDGSQDNSAEIILGRKHSNWKVVKQPNKKQGAARNNGLAHSGAEYVWFVDGDDAIAPNCLGKLYSTAKTNNLDVLLFKINKVKQGSVIGQIPENEFAAQNRVLGGADYLNMRQLTLCSVYIYKRSFLTENNLRYIEGVFFEDSEFMPRVFCLAKRIMFIPMPAYIYIERTNSTTKSFTVEKCVSSAAATMQMCTNAALARKNVCSAMHYYAAMQFNTTFAIYRKLKNKKAVQLNKSLKRKVVASMLRAKRPKYFAEGVFLQLFWRFIFN